MEQTQLQQQLTNLWHEMDKVIIGRKETFKKIFTALLTEGHILFEDLPGTGKTTMVKAFSRGVDCLFSRIQCTPDLLPSDILGGSIFNPQTNDFYLRKGPVFTNILLVDEINRALPRTQSSLLECMEEGQVTIEGETHSLTSPFIVLATQNPVDSEGTFPLPEAQMDRFLMRLKLGYPTIEEEIQMLEQVGDEIPFDEVENQFTPEEITNLQKACQSVRVESAILQYITNLADKTRNHPLISVGVSPRATKALYKTVKTWAFLNGRDYVIPDDVKALVVDVWSHRMILQTEARMSDESAENVLETIVEETPLPKEQVIRT